MKHYGTSVALLGALAFACASPPSTGSEKIDPEFQALALPSVPTDVATRTFVDFGGKVHLVGWEVSPAGFAAPGSNVSLKLYWRAVKQVPACYRLYTNFTGPDGKSHAFDDVGPLRASTESETGKVPRFPPSAWTPGTIYVDEQRLTVPQVDVPELTLSVGVSCPSFEMEDGKLERAGEFKLGVLSGVSDGKDGALVARFKTGVKRGDKAKDKDGRRRPGVRPGSERRLGEPLGRGPMGRVPGSERENPK
ncbi:MAG TPA: hypothetical protein VFZ53_26730 [Polyangiaceae bacterium]